MRRRMTGKKEIREMAAMISSTYFDDFRPGLERCLRLSRSKKKMHDPRVHIGVQLAILEIIEEGDEAYRLGKGLAKSNGKQQHIQNLRNQQINIAFRTIADGMAWRTLNFNRFHIRILSQAQSPGAADNKDGRASETRMAVRVAENGHFALLNDAGNLLRVGDLIFINPEDKPHHLSIAEIKKKKKNNSGLIMAGSIIKKLKDGKAINKQEKRLLQAQIAIDDKAFTVADHTYPVLEVNPKRRTHYLRKVNQLIIRANKNGVAEDLITPYMQVSVVDLKVIKAGDKSLLDGDKLPLDKEMLLVWNSYDSLALLREKEALRSTAPYSIFPFSVKNVTKLNLGEILLQVAILKEPLVDKFKALGWDLVLDQKAFDDYNPLDSEDMVKHFSSEILFPDEGFKGKDIFFLCHPSNGFKFPVWHLLIQMMHEYVSAEYVADVVREVMLASSPGKANSYYVLDVGDIERWK